MIFKQNSFEILYSTFSQANPKLAERRDDDERLPIHWAVSYGHLDIALLLANLKSFDPDVQVRYLLYFNHHQGTSKC